MAPDPKKARQRIALAVRDYFMSIRSDMDELLGAGNHSLASAVLVQQLLGEGQAFAVPGQPERVVLRKRFGGHCYDTEMYADHFGEAEPVRTAPEDELFDDLVTFDADRVPDEVLARLEAACAASGPKKWGSMQPKIAKLRARQRAYPISSGRNEV